MGQMDSDEIDLCQPCAELVNAALGVAIVHTRVAQRGSAHERARKVTPTYAFRLSNGSGPGVDEPGR